MSYQALARKYRPQNFDDIVGQETAVRTLHNAIDQQRIHHAYLFSGVRGVGKTTLARILAKALNCVQGPTADPDNECTTCREITEGIDLDVREIDAATYTGVDNVRELRDVSQFQPARDRYRIFIIDEAHMLSAASWNALLKLIEEPPPHVVFMFATTEMQKVPQTILSRVQKIGLRKISLEDLIARLRQVCEWEGIKADDAALEIVARRGEGSVRDALSLLDQIIAFSGRSVTAADVAAILGLSETSLFGRLVTAAGEGDHATILEALQEASDAGRDFKMLYRDLLAFVRNLLLVSGGANEAMLAAPPEELPLIREVATRFSYSELLRLANLLLQDDETVNRSEHQRLAVEIALLKAATFPRLRSVEQALAGGQKAEGRAQRAERRGQSATPATPPSTLDSRPSTLNSSTLVDRVKSQRPLIGGYLQDARVEKNGNVVTIYLRDSFAAETIADAKDAIAKIASDMYGETVSVDTRVETSEHGRRAEDKPAPLQDDPVLGAFRKHLGGELVKENR
jgi:DNA polymerase-3 subunit gamma/tau